MKRRFYALLLAAGLVLGLFSGAGTLTVRADYDFSDTTFIGDSRIKTMGTGGRYEFALLKDTDIYATWAVLTTQKPAFDDAWMAGYQKRPKAVFWYGINDVQVGDREDYEDFVRHMDDLIITFHEENNFAEIYILSVLTTTPQEKDYYEGQNENIARYNQGLAAYCAANGYHFVDITDLYSDADIIEGDNIHFKQEWYVNKFLPRIDSVLHPAPTPPPTETEAPTEEPTTEAPTEDVTESVSETPQESAESPSETQEIQTTKAPETSVAPSKGGNENNEKKPLTAGQIILIVAGVLLLLGGAAVGWMAYKNYQQRKRRRERRRRRQNRKN
ncbi:MAG: hypothetical protein J6Z38_08640 [Lachnospiraceae bacterium]|nr:hypothetical protein [Lachnospiraceae bacterium]